MKKLVFTDGKRTTVHFTSEFKINGGVITFYKDDVQDINNYCCIDVKHLWSIKEEA